MFRKVVQMLNKASRKDDNRAMHSPRADIALGHATQVSTSQREQHSLHGLRLLG